MSNTFEDRVGYLATLTEYAGMADIDPLLKAHKRVFLGAVLLFDGQECIVTEADIDLLWGLVCHVLQMDPNKKYPNGDAFMVAFYRAKGKIV